MLLKKEQIPDHLIAYFKEVPGGMSHNAHPT